jgi:hypothetical protein
LLGVSGSCHLENTQHKKGLVEWLKVFKLQYHKTKQKNPMITSNIYFALFSFSSSLVVPITYIYIFRNNYTALKVLEEYEL